MTSATDTRNGRLGLLIAIVVVVFGIAFFLSKPSRPAPVTPAAPAAGSEVPWGDYASGVRARIDGAASSKDCAVLQAEFDAADANNEATLARTGHNNAKLMAYIDSAMRGAGCY